MKVICYLRAPHDWFASLVQQWVRGGAVLEDALQIKFPDIRAHIEPFVRHFGKTNILIKKFEDAVEHQAGPFGHFLSQISEGLDTSRIRSRLVNTALSAEGVQLVSALNADDRAASKGLPLGVAREYLTPFCGIRGAKFVLPISTQERVWKEARKSLEWIESSFEIEMYREFEYIESSRPTWDEDALLSLA
ncbi:MAG: hypothetical protein MUE56_07950, partial [Ignavibacteria bacterium]|nr:hypothetical protein [Ignavibacteria bacterium]